MITKLKEYLLERKKQSIIRIEEKRR